MSRAIFKKKTARRRSFCSAVEASTQATWNALLPPIMYRSHLSSASAVCEVQKLFSDQEVGKRCSHATRDRRFRSHPTSSNSVKAAHGRSRCRKRQSNTLSLLTNHVWITCHLSRPLDWKSKRGDRASCSSKKNLNVSLPVGPPESMECVCSQRSHSRIIRILTFLCLISVRPLSPLRAQMVALVW
jgi:hypothetical protein